MNPCEVTKIWPTKNGVILPIVSMRNKKNQYGITHKYGRRAGQLKKNKLLKEKDINNAQIEV